MSVIVDCRIENEGTMGIGNFIYVSIYIQVSNRQRRHAASS